MFFKMKEGKVFFNNSMRPKKKLAKYQNRAILMEIIYSDLREENLELKKTNERLKELNKRLFGDVKAEREVKERYRTAFLRRMNVPMIGTSWDGDIDNEGEWEE